MEEIIKEFREKYSWMYSVFYTDKNGEQQPEYPKAEDWLKEKLEAFEKKTKEEFLKNEIAYWKDIFDSRPTNRNIERDTIAQNFARIEIERLEKILSNASKEGINLK